MSEMERSLVSSKAFSTASEPTLNFFTALGMFSAENEEGRLR